MSLNTNSHFSMAPHANIPRSRFDMSHTRKQTMDAGYLVPFDLVEVLPGDTFSVDTALLARMQTLIVPLMDDLYVDIYWFYVPSRLLWKNWERFCGENDEPWFDDTEYTVPQIAVNVKSQTGTDCVKLNTLADYLGLPLAPENGTGTYQRKYNHLPFRGYVKIWSDWFRNENTQALPAFNTEDNDVTMNNVGEAFYGGKLLPVNRYRDYFSSALPGPQRSTDPVTFNLMETTLPVHTGGNGLDRYEAIYMHDSVGGYSANTYHNLAYFEGTDADDRGSLFGFEPNVTVSNAVHRMSQNWYVDLAANLNGISINELRYAFATQRYLEALARSGSRYIEMLEGIFGVTAPDARLQRSEFLGGNRVRISINSVTQQSETGETPLGNLGAYSLTTDNQNSFTKSFVEHGYLYGLCCVRYKNSYQDGIPTIFQRKDFEDFYNPYFANIGEQPIINQTLYVDGSDADLEVFGYQEAWADYRYGFNTVAGEMRSRAGSNTLDYWHLADDYTSRPYLDDDWSTSDGQTIDRTLAVSSRVSNQFLMDFYINCKATRPMPMYSVPGLDIL